MNQMNQVQDRNRISSTLHSLKRQNGKALVCFQTAGFPTPGMTVPFVLSLAKGGADLIEIGMPFSDPLADGPLIQHSSQVAIRQGITLDKILSYVRTIRRRSEVPLILMGYLNPILNYGIEKFFAAAAHAGVDGFILPELPFEESGRYQEVFETNRLANILLVTPTTPADRIKAIDRASSGFLYCVSRTGVTGFAGHAIHGSYIEKVKKTARKNPVLAGFGIKTPDDAHRIARHADGVIVASTLIRKIIDGESPHQLALAVRRLKEAMAPTNDRY
jgi:tryptophan synthase alpha chain